MGNQPGGVTSTLLEAKRSRPNNIMSLEPVALEFLSPFCFGDFEEDLSHPCCPVSLPNRKNKFTTIESINLMKDQVLIY